MHTRRVLPLLLLVLGACPQQPAGPPPDAAGLDPALLDPQRASARAPDLFAVRLETTKGDLVIDVHRDWAPLGADRFYNLVKIGFFDDTAFFRVVPGFVAQAGLHGLPQVSAAWRDARIGDDPSGKQSNTRGTVTFATAGPSTRTTQIFLNYGDNSALDPIGFPPFGKVRDMAVADRLEAGYGEGPPRGSGPSQPRIQSEGNAYLRAAFPKLDYTKKATILP